MPSGAERRTLYPAAAGVLLVADLASKALAERMLDAHTVVPVLGDVLRFHLVYNPGADSVSTSASTRAGSSSPPPPSRSSC
jgi:lipoprotein signal peptidase